MPESIPDDVLIDQTLAGDRSAYGQLVTRYQDRLFSLVAQWLANAEDAKDVVQEAFVQAYIKLKSFGRRSAFYTWLYRIAHNLAVTHHRKHHPRHHFGQRADLSTDEIRHFTGDEPADAGPLPGDRLEAAERARQIQEALARLSREHRTILVLREMEGCSYEQISEILDVPSGTVRSRLHRARLHLKDLLLPVCGPVLE
jgi:RNA polymerase sigma-70 factor (ECF subfamily)